MRKLNCHIIKLSDYFFGYDKEKIAQKLEKIYSRGEGANSPGGFRYKRTRKTNKTTL